MAPRVALGVETDLPDGATRRFMAWTWPTSSRSRGSVASRRWRGILMMSVRHENAERQLLTYAWHLRQVAPSMPEGAVA